MALAASSPSFAKFLHGAQLKNGKSYNLIPPLQPGESARAAGLRYVSDASTPGLRRVRAGKTFRYVRPDGSALRDPASLARIRGLAIPPAWTDVWICPIDDGHLQATGRDARGRKQYRYHRRWREVRDETKYGKLLAFAAALPKIRRRAARDLALPGMPREKVLATVVRLLEATRIRVGNEEYARQNESYGLTTLRERQVKVRGPSIRFRFKGKSGVNHEIELSDPRLAKIVRRMQDLPGEELFQYVDDKGATHRIESSDVNAYLKEIAAEDFTSKDFRTWAATVLAARGLRRMKPARSQAEAKRQIAKAVEAVAMQLGNTPAVCRKCYIHPAILESYAEGSLAKELQGRSEEAAVSALLHARLKREADAARRSGANGRSLAPVLARSLARLRHGRGLQAGQARTLPTS